MFLGFAFMFAWLSNDSLKMLLTLIRFLIDSFENFIGFRLLPLGDSLIFDWFCLFVHWFSIDVLRYFLYVQFILFGFSLMPIWFLIGVLMFLIDFRLISDSFSYAFHWFPINYLTFFSNTVYSFTSACGKSYFRWAFNTILGKTDGNRTLPYDARTIWNRIAHNTFTYKTLRHI